jgi:hypothetical protein
MLIMKLKTTVVPVHVGVTSNVCISVHHVSREVHFLLVVHIVERLPVMITDQLLSQNSLNIASDKAA